MRGKGGQAVEKRCCRGEEEEDVEWQSWEGYSVLAPAMGMLTRAKL